MASAPQDELIVGACRRFVGDGATWAVVAGAGFGVLGLDAARGGGGAGARDVALVAEELARGPLPVPFVGTALATDLLARAEGDDVAEVLAALVEGRPSAIVLEPALGRVAATGIAVDTAGSDAAEVLAVGWRAGDVVVTFAGEEIESVDLTRGLARVAGAVEPVGRIDDHELAQWLTLARTVVSADLVGAMQAALDAAVAHAADREQFGRPVGSFQAVQQLCADQLVTVEAARSITRAAAAAIDRSATTEAEELSLVAKAYCSEAGRAVTEAALQVWGGIGMTWECPAHRWLRRALLSRRLFGDETASLRALAHDHLFGPVPS